MNKRGVSPLTATLLLIVLSAVLGAGVMSAGKSYIEERAEFVKGTPISSCAEAMVNFITVGNDPQVCVDIATKMLKFFVESAKGVSQVQLRIVGSDDILTKENLLSSPLTAGESRKFEVPYEGIGEVRQVKLTPYVGSGSSRQSCAPLMVDAPLRVC